MKNKRSKFWYVINGVLVIILLYYFWRSNNLNHNNKLEGVWKVRKVQNDNEDWLYSKFFFFEDSLIVHADEHIRVKSNWKVYKINMKGKFIQTDSIIHWYLNDDTIEYVYKFIPSAKLELKQKGTRKFYSLELQ